RKQAMRFGMNLGYTIRDLNFSELLFGDQLISGAPTTSSTAASNYRGQVVTYADIGAGVLYYTRRAWFGFAGHHLNQPNQSLLSGESRLPLKYSLHAGWNFTLKKDRRRNPISSLIVSGNYKAQLRWDQLDIGAYFNYGLFVTGLWYRGIPVKRLEPEIQNNDAIVVLAGFKWNDFRFGYSYDLTISRLVTNSGGAHEISLIYEHASPSKKRKKARSRFLVPCAKF
ncbi:MAG: PorP/SprF family type IX secretion system membrane protein, partial [Salibacteraceae bacterium]